MLKVDLKGLREFVKRFSDPAIREELRRIPAQKGVAAIVSQAIADNFELEGPGWAPLKVATLRASVKKGVIKKIQKRFMSAHGVKNKSKLSKTQRSSMRRVVDSQLLAHERSARTQSNMQKASGDKTKIIANRKILQKTGLLKKTATVIGFTGSNKQATGSNIYSVQGTNLIWGTNLAYAAAHNEGDPSHNIPQREFLTIRDEWKLKLSAFIVGKTIETIKKYLVKGK